MTEPASQPIRGLVFGGKSQEFISLSQIKGHYNFSWDGQNILNLFIPMTCKVVPTFVVSCIKYWQCIVVFCTSLDSSIIEFDIM